jgi:ABC-type multidrug transport system fused ATPase/permease subunit
MILDEPTAGLDQAGRAALMADLLTVTAGRTTLLITHDMAGLDQLDEIVVLDHGRVVERGSPDELQAAGGQFRAMLDQAGATVD